LEHIRDAGELDEGSINIVTTFLDAWERRRNGQDT